MSGYDVFLVAYYAILVWAFVCSYRAFRVRNKMLNGIRDVIESPEWHTARPLLNAFSGISYWRHIGRLFVFRDGLALYPEKLRAFGGAK